MGFICRKHMEINALKALFRRTARASLDHPTFSEAHDVRFTPRTESTIGENFCLEAAS